MVGLTDARRAIAPRRLAQRSRRYSQQRTALRPRDRSRKGKRNREDDGLNRPSDHNCNFGTRVRSHEQRERTLASSSNGRGAIPRPDWDLRLGDDWRDPNNVEVKQSIKRRCSQNPAKSGQIRPNPATRKGWRVESRNSREADKTGHLRTGGCVEVGESSLEADKSGHGPERWRAKRGGSREAH
jgi:hypothetical protein